jgi:hypothetical protein
LLLLGRAERADRIDRADAAVHAGHAGNRRIVQGHACEEPGEAGKRRSAAAVWLVDQQAPVTHGGQVAQHLVGDLVPLVEQRAGLAMAADDLDRGVHHLLHIRRRGDRRAGELLDRQLPLPHGPVDRTVDGLIARCEQGFNLIVGPIDRAGAAGLLGALAPQRQRRFGERSRLVLRLAVARGLVRPLRVLLTSFGSHGRCPS